MTFELVQKIVKSIISSIETSAVLSVRALKAHTFSVKVSNYPRTQAIKGTVTVGNQRVVEKLLGELKVAVGKLPTIYPETKIPAPLPYPKELRVSNLEDVPTADLKRVEELLMKLVREIRTLPKEFPKQEKVVFPKIEIPKFPDINFPAFPKKMEVNVPSEIRVNNIQDLLDELTNQKATKYLNVRLTDGKEFYKAIESIVSGVSSKLPFMDKNGNPTMVGLTINGLIPMAVSEAVPTDDTQLNASTTYTEVTVGTVTTTTLDMVVDAITYQKVFVEDTSTGVTTESSWEVV